MPAVKGVQSADDIEEIWQQYWQSGTLELRNKLINSYLERTRALAAYLYASRISNIADYDDYLHYGVLGLIDSIDKYDPSYGAQFFTYASYRIKGSIVDGISSMEEKTASPANELIYRTRLLSINEYQYDNEDLFENLIETSVMLAIGVMLEDVDTEADQYKSQAFQEIKQTLQSYVDLLDKDQKAVIQYHYFHQFSFVTIAEMLGVTKSRVSQLHKSALSELRLKSSHTLELEY